MRSSLIIAIGALWLLQACSPEPVYRLKAEAEEKKTSYYQGVEYVHLQQDSVFLTVSYYEHTPSLFALEVEVENRGDRIIRVSPDSMMYRSYGKPTPEQPGRLLTTRYAKSPERKILNLDLALSQQKANRQTDEFLFYTMQGLTLASGIAADNPEEREEASEQLTENAIEQEIDRAHYRYNRSSLRETREFWKAKTLRITDLWPGDYVRGLVYFKTDPDAKLYHFILKVENQTYDIWFRQHKFEP